MIISQQWSRSTTTCWSCFMRHVCFSFKSYPKNKNIEINQLFCSFISGCGHCTKLKPAYSEASARVSKDKIGALSIVDATIHEKLAQKYDIKGFPTIKFFQKGSLKSEYSGQRTVDDIHKFMKLNAIKSKDEL